jgi:sensor histidine kinase YesM
MTLFKKNSLLLFLLFVLNIAIGQTIPSKNITINDGLPSNSIKCFFKDSRGLMWIGTEAGLCCYDGTSYKIYNETNGLKYSNVWSIAEDKDKNIWLSLYGNGLAKFDGKKFIYFNSKDGLINNCIRKIYYSNKHNCLILGTENGLSLFDGKHFKSFVPKTTKGNFQVVGISEKANQTLITVSYSDVFNLEISKDIQQSTLKKVFTPSTILYSSFINGDTYFGGGSFADLYLKNLKTNSETKISCPIIWDFAKDDENNIYGSAWNVTNPIGGLFKFSNNQLTDITQKANIKSTSLWCLYYDKETKQLWVGSVDKGVYIVDLSSQKKIFEPSFFGLKQLEIQCLYNDSMNNIWIGARDNVIILHKDLSFIIIDKNQLWKKIDAYFKQYSLSPYSVEKYNSTMKQNGFTCYNITTDNSGNTWVSTTFGIFCFDKKNELRYFIFTEGGHITFDENDQLLFGEMYYNIFLYPNKFDRLNCKQLSIKDKNIPKDITRIIRNHNQTWFGSSSNGLYIYHNNTFHSLNLQKQFSEKYIKDIIINDKGELVIGTNSGRIYICKWSSNKLQILHVYYPNKDLYGTSISFIRQSNGYYFIGTNKGINVIKDRKFIKLINQSEGINDVQFNDSSKDKNGNLWIATNDGLMFLDVKKSLLKKSCQNSIQITNIKVNGVNHKANSDNLHWGSYRNSELKLNYNHNDIEIFFNNYNLFNADKNIYRYKVDGLTNTWSEFDNSTKIQLRGIPNGKYKLIIEGKNIGSGTVFQSKILSLTITPPFWKASWFILICIIAILLIGIVSYKKRVQFLQDKSDIQKRLAETKMEALQSQMNPHFIFNAMNSIQNFIIKNNVDEALMYMTEFSKLIRQTLDNSSQPKISLEKEIHYLETYIKLENMRFKEAVNFKINLAKEMDTFAIEIPPMLLQPFIENVFVHAFDSKSKNPILEVTFLLKDNLLICEIKDNGKGINKERLNKLNTSKGIKLVKERIGLIQLVNADTVTINSVPNQGTTIILNIEFEV